jgi:hypothetical protein
MVHRRPSRELAGFCLRIVFPMLVERVIMMAIGCFAKERLADGGRGTSFGRKPCLDDD